jgi:hypothetical protein
MKNRILLLTAITSTLLIFGTCNDPVFYTISQEVAPKDPRIKGSPTNFVIYKEAMLVASGSKLFRYKSDEAGKWGWDLPESQPGGKIAQITVTKEYLYALCYEDEKTTKKFIKRFDETNQTWEELYNDTISSNKFQCIFSANEIVFLNTSDINYYNHLNPVLYIDKNGNLKDLFLAGTGTKVNGEISGVVFKDDAYYLCTMGQGIFFISDPAIGAILIRDTDNIKFKGMICLENTAKTILLIARNGELFYLNDTDNGFEFSKKDDVSMGNNRMATGAIFVWKDDLNYPLHKLLLVGRQDRLEYTIDSGYTYGYLELVLDDANNIDGIEAEAKFKEPGINAVSSVHSGSEQNERYKSTIGKYPVNSIIQAPNPEGTLFATTPQNGVWSYRESDKGVWQWNAEE